MNTLQFCLALGTLLFWLFILLELYIGNRSLKFLSDFGGFPVSPRPRVSVIVPARNEERHLREALRSLLQQDYGNFEIIIVNDRSTDSTATILAEMEKLHPDLQVYTITELPPGWLGKNHALQFGAERAGGDILLFTDADVIMRPDTLSRAVAWLQENNIDHLCLMPGIRISGPLMGIFVMTFGIFFWLYALPWRAANPASRKHVGIGGFNMLRAGVYRAIGMHRPIALRPDDDMKLGKLVKIHGYRQRLLHAESHLAVEWYGSVRELIDGLMKNAFAGVEYSIAAVVLFTILQFTFSIWPLFALFMTTGWIQVFYLVTVLIMLTLCLDTVRMQRLRPWYCLGFPLGILMFVYIMWRAMVLNIRDDGITWRGTHYPLAQLKANRIP